MKALLVSFLVLIGGLHYADKAQNAVAIAKEKRVQTIENIVSGV